MLHGNDIIAVLSTAAVREFYFHNCPKLLELACNLLTTFPALCGI